MRAPGGRVETEGLHFIYRAILPQPVLFVKSFLKNFFLYSKGKDIAHKMQ